MSQGGANSSTGTGTASVETLTGNSGGAVGPDAAFNIDVLGNNSSGIDVVGTPGSSLLTIIGLQASDTQRGTVELATDGEAVLGTATDLAVSPSNLPAVFASPFPIGSTAPNTGSFTEVDVDNIHLDGNTISTTDTNGNLLLVPDGSGAVALPTNQLYVGSTAPSNPYDISIEGSVAGLVGQSIQNTLVNAAAGVNLQLIVEPLAGDAFTGFFVNGGGSFSAGIDNSDSDSFKITTGSSPSAGTTAINITSSGVVTLPGGPLDVPSGGTGLATITDHAVLIGSGTGAITTVGPVASTGALLASNGAANDPGFTTATYPLVTTVSEILYSSATNTVTGLATAVGGLLLTDSGGVPSIGNSLDGSFTFTNATAGTTRTVSITHTDATGAAVSSAALELTTQSGSAGDPYVRLNVNGGQDYALGIDNSDSDALKINDDVDPSTGNNLWKMTSAGERTMSLQPAFLAYLPSNDLNVTGNGTTYTLGTNTALTEVFDQNSDFNTNGTFTAPVTGRYDLKGFMEMVAASMSGATIYSQTLVTSNRTYRSSAQNSGAAEPFKNNKVCALADMDAADTATFNVAVTGIGADTADITGSASAFTYFCGSLIC